MTDKPWKRAERQVASDFGTTRNPNDGRARLDISAGPWAIEHKQRQRLPSWLWKAMEQAQAGAQGTQTPIVVLTEVSQGKRARRLVVMRYEDFLEWHG